MNTVEVVTSHHADVAWIARVVDGELALASAGVPADVIVVSADAYGGVIEQRPAGAVLVVIGDPREPPARVAHVITRGWPDDQLRTLLVALATGTLGPEPPLTPPSTPAEARSAQSVIAGGRKIASVTDGLGLETAVTERLVELLHADRAYCLFHDHADGSLWSEERLRGPAGDERVAASGLAGYAVRTGTLAIAPRGVDDPRFVAAIDDPGGDPIDHVIAQPVFGADGKVHAVLVGVRRGGRPAFGGGAIAVLARLARQITPVLDTLSVDAQAQQILDDEVGGDGLFRRQAVQAQDAPRWGDVVRVSPGWLPWAYWLLVGLLVASAAFIVFGTVATYSEGPAVIRSNARTPISARSAGNVVAVEVTSGDVAEPGTVIARLDDTEQRATVANLTQKFEAELRAHMLSNAQTNPALATTRQLLADARAGLDERLIVATTHGVIGDLRVRAGQRVAPGDTIASVVDASMGLELTALLPGEDRPQLQPGMVLRLELVGYRYAFQTVTIDWVSPDVIAPAEARRVVGAEVAEGLPLTGPVVVVRGRLRAPEFELDGVRYRYHDGMMGQARVRVRAEPIVFALLPGTRRLSE